MISHFDALRQATEILSGAPVDNAAFDAKQLLLFAFSLSPEEYAARKNEPCDNARLVRFYEFVERRKNREPLQYILGNWEFLFREFTVGSGALIPRPETELLVRAATELKLTKPFFADMCSGSGCIGISYALETPDAEGLLLDISQEALAIGEENRKRYALDRLVSRRFDVFTDTLPEGIDLLMSNPPYITSADMLTLEKELSYEPRIALHGGDDGLDFYKCISRRHVSSLKTGAYVLFELGIGQCEAVCNELHSAGAELINVIRDDGGIERTLVAVKK